MVRRGNVQAEADSSGDGVESAARKARYLLLGEMAEAVGARYVATGHTRDDQAETVLFRLLRGSGLRGLAGMPRTRPLTPAVALVRPLLDASRREVEAYLAEIGQGFRRDATNDDPAHARNRLRGEVLPLLRSAMGASVDQALLGAARNAAETSEFVERCAETLLETCCEDIERRDGVVIAVRLAWAPLAAAEPLLACEALRLLWRRSAWPQQAMSRRRWLETVALAQANSPGGKLTLPGGLTVERTDGAVLFLFSAGGGERP
jgi:tRNA(Ile)-lysidine synthase